LVEFNEAQEEQKKLRKLTSRSVRFPISNAFINGDQRIGRTIVTLKKKTFVHLAVRKKILSCSYLSHVPLDE